MYKLFSAYACYTCQCHEQKHPALSKPLRMVNCPTNRRERPTPEGMQKNGHYPACACAAGVKQCLRVCVCVRKTKLKNASNRVTRRYRRHSQWKTISIILLGHFCTWYKSRRFFTLLFQLLPIIGFVAPPLLKTHLVVTGSATQLAHSQDPIRENTGRMDLATYGAWGKYSMNTL